MLAYTTIGTNQWDKACAFYDALFADIGAKALFDLERFRGYGRSMNEPFFALCKPFNEEPATVGNGTMAAIQCSDKAQVKDMHDKAVELGGTSEGEPGPRGGGAFYLAYARDLDGNKLAFFAPV